MANQGRIQALCIATQDSDNVVYERFYDLFSENDKADIRAAFAEATVDLDRSDTEGVGRYKDGHIVAVPSGDLYFYALGTDEYNELIRMQEREGTAYASDWGAIVCTRVLVFDDRRVAEVLRSLIAAFKDILRSRVLTDKVIFAHYAQAALIADAVIKEGIPELLDTASIVKALSFKFPVLRPEDEVKSGKAKKGAA